MATLRQVFNNVNALDVVKESMVVINDHSEDIVELNKKQMLKGENNIDQSLPRYVDDPYFKSRESALRYQSWKESISPNKQKPSGVMDFYINGKYHNSLIMQTSKDYFVIKSLSPINGSISNKTSGRHLGLNKKTKAIMINDFFFAELMERIKSVTKL